MSESEKEILVNENDAQQINGRAGETVSFFW